VASVRVSAIAGTATGPRFSVVVPAYQAAPTLGATLDAILAQTLTDWECVVVDDGSTDHTLLIATAYAQRDPRFRVVHQSNQGTAGAYNAGVSSAVGDFVVLCSADDILLPEHLSRMSAFIDSEGGYDVYSSNGYYWWPGDDRELAYGPDERREIHSLELSDVIRICFYSVGATYRRELHAAVGGYRPGVFGEDYDFWLRALASGARHRYLPEPLSLFRVSPFQKSAKLEAVFRSDIRLVSDLRRDFHLSAAEDVAVAQTILELERRIARIRQPWTRVRRSVRQFVVRVLGRRRARRISRRLRSMIGRPVPSSASGLDQDPVAGHDSVQ
jgi:glycosyltransferase involved in cell wall biosynthesis